MHVSPDDCVNKEYSGGEWVSHNLVPRGKLPLDCVMSLPTGDQRRVMGKVSQNFDQLATPLNVGSYFAVQSEVGNEEEVEYYILQCTRPLEVLRESRMCAWDDSTFLLG